MKIFFKVNKGLGKSGYTKAALVPAVSIRSTVARMNGRVNRVTIVPLLH